MGKIPLNLTKAQLRERLIVLRNRLSARARAEKNRAIQANLTNLAELNAAKNIFSFISHGTESKTRNLLQWSLDQGKHLCVPKIINNKEMLAVAFTDWSELHPGRWGIPAPITSTVFTGSIDVCITPGLGFTIMGGRLGQGQGYYDRWFASHSVGLKIGLAYECQILDELPLEKQDIVMDMIITEQRIIRVKQLT